jgi:hypothetical protein
VFRVHLPPWLVVFLVLTALTLCCILSGICVAHHSQFVRASCALCAARRLCR